MKRDERTPMDFRAGLKVKIKSLAEEARMIRGMERATRSEKMRLSLHDLRVGRVRQAARETQLAYAFIRGKAYREVERSPRLCYDAINWQRVAVMAYAHGAWGMACRAICWEESIRKLRVDLESWEMISLAKV
jgi:hypothetical protein